MRRGHRLALQATLQVQPADKRLSLVLRIGLMIGPSLRECFDSLEASNLLARKTHVLELPNARHSGELLSEFHGHPPVSPSKRVAGCTTANVRYPRSSRCISQFSLDRLPGICLIVDVQWCYWPDILATSLVCYEYRRTTWRSHWPSASMSPLTSLCFPGFESDTNGAWARGSSFARKPAIIEGENRNGGMELPGSSSIRPRTDVDPNGAHAR